MSHIKFNTWNPHFSPDKPFTMIVSASRNSGKSNLIKHLYLDHWYPQKCFDSVVLFSTTLVTDYYANFLPGRLQYNKYNPEILKSVFESTKRTMARGKKWKVLVILDDCISNKDRYCQQLNNIFTMGRHVNISVVYITQKLSFCGNTWFNNASYLVFLRNKSRAEQKYIAEKALVEPLSSAFPDTVKEQQIINFCIRRLKADTRDYHALIVEPLSEAPPNVPEDEEYKYQIFKYKAPLK